MNVLEGHEQINARGIEGKGASFLLVGTNISPPL